MTTVSEICVNAVRGMLIADEGKKLVVADLSNIEGRVAAWLANEEWKLQAFRDFDTIIGTDADGEPIRKGHDLYKIGAGRILGKRPEDVTKLERQNEGKVPELACQFQGAVGAFATMGANFGVVLPEERVIEIVKAWRKSHPRIVSTWYAIEDAAKAAIRFPHERFEVNGFLHFDNVDGWLRIRLPSGRYLSYPKARVGEVCHRCGGSGQHLESGVANATKMVVCLGCDGSGKADTQLRYDGVDQYTKKWGTIRTYGGKTFENCIAAGTLTLTDAGWLPIEQVRVDHRLWDGEEWVRHEGLAFKGVQEVIAAHGVMMTPDHEILTTEGWVSASQSKRYNRTSCRLPEQDNAALPSDHRCEWLAPVYSAEPLQPVLDIVNCGPRQRFVVLSSDGRPLIVHNCVQAIARDVFMCGFRAAEREGYAVVSRVHDELITEVPDDPRYNAEHLSALMAANPPWAVGLPLAAAGHEMYRYAKLD